MLDVMGTETVLDQHYSKCLLSCSIEVNDRIVIFRWAIPLTAVTYAVGRSGSCWPGSAEYQRRSYTGTSAYRAKSECPADLTDTPHTRYCCHCSHHQMAGENNHNEIFH